MGTFRFTKPGYDWLNLLRMALDPAVLRDLLWTHQQFRKDPGYSLARGMRTTAQMVWGEKIVRHGGAYTLSTFMPPFPSRAFRSNVLAVSDKQRAFTLQAQAQRTAPISFYLAVTGKCSLNCLHCSAKVPREGRELTTQEWQGVLRDLQDMGTSVIGFTGGEPLLRKDILELVRTVDARSKSILFTSGHGVTRTQVQELASAGLYGLGVSLDSHDPAVHDQQRRQPGVHAQALQTMRWARDAGLYVMAQTVVPRSRLVPVDLQRTFACAGQNGAHEVKILEPLIAGNLIAHQPEDYFYSLQDRGRLTSIQHAANRRRDLPKISTFAFTESQAKFGCGAGSQHSYIAWDGSLQACDFVALPFGNVLEHPVGDLWKAMNAGMGMPGSECLANLVGKQARQGLGNKTKSTPQESLVQCQGCRSKSTEGGQQMPRYYQVMQGACVP